MLLSNTSPAQLEHPLQQITQDLEQQSSAAKAQHLPQQPPLTIPLPLPPQQQLQQLQLHLQQQQRQQQQHQQHIYSNDNSNSSPHYISNNNADLNVNASSKSTSAAVAAAAAAAAATLLLQHTGTLVPAVAAEPTPASAAAATTYLIHSNSCAGAATDFSIAAIMARGANASSREPSERSLSPLSVERYPDPDDDVDVDVVDCSDSEAPSARSIRQQLTSHHSHQQHQHKQRQHQHHHSQQSNLHGNNNNNNGNSNSNTGHHHNAHRSRSNNNNNNNSSNNCHNPNSSNRGRGSPQSPNSTATNDDDRLSPEPAQPSPKILGSCNCDEMLPVQCHLETKELWEKFHDLGTEMIITKTGRRMFPTVRVSFSGPLRQIQPPDRYAVVLDVVPMDSRRYRYAYHRSSWLVAGKADPPPPARLYPHPDSPISVEALRKQVVSFEKVKLTNNEMDKNGQIVLNSMHRYQPRIHLVRLSHGQSIPTNPKELQDVDHKTFVFPETVFTAVTAYQNQLITKLKIDSNPFAKGFRDSSRLTDFDRDPMDSFLLEQHLRSPLRFFPDPLMAQLTPQEADAASLAFLEKARQHLQMFGRSPYTEMLLPQLYQRPPALNAFNLGMWQQQWPQLTAGFIASANQQAAAAQAAAAAAVAASACRTPPPLQQQQHQQMMTNLVPPPPATTPSSSGSASPDMRAKHYQRYSPYQVPQQQQQQQSQPQPQLTQPPLARTPPN